MEDVTSQQDSDEEVEEDAHQKSGSLIVIGNTKGNQAVQRSTCKQKEGTPTLSRIPKGVTILSDLLGCVDKLKYYVHDVTDMENFHEFVP